MGKNAEIKVLSIEHKNILSESDTESVTVTGSITSIANSDNENENESIQAKSSQTQTNDWELITTAKGNDQHFVAKYRSASTGLQLVHAKINGPMIHTSVVVACQNDSSGTGRYLERLISHGSEDYPFYNALQEIGKKCMVKEMKSWTGVESSTFTATMVQTPVSLQKMLSVLLDHVFFPLLDSNSYLLDIYSVDGNGQEEGSLFLEFGSKTTKGQVMGDILLAMRQLIYPPDSEYFHDERGNRNELRDDVTKDHNLIDKVRQFHKEFYRPENTCIVICGDVNTEDVFQVLVPFMDKLRDRGLVSKQASLEKVGESLINNDKLDGDDVGKDSEKGTEEIEDDAETGDVEEDVEEEEIEEDVNVVEVVEQSSKVVDKVDEEKEEEETTLQMKNASSMLPLQKVNKIWLKQSPVELTSNLTAKQILVPSLETYSQGTIGFIGPSVLEPRENTVGIRLLMHYLVNVPLAKELCFSTNTPGIKIFPGEIPFFQSIFYFTFYFVPEDQLSSLESLMRNSFRNVTPNNFNMTIMQSIIAKAYQSEMRALEFSPHDEIERAITTDFIYGPEDNGLFFDNCINNTTCIHELRNRPAEFWVSLLKCILDKKWVVVHAKPSAELFKAQETNERNTLKNHLETIGSGLILEGESLTAAKEWATREIPPELLQVSFSPENMAKFTPVKPVLVPDWLKSSPCNFILDDMSSSTVSITVLMDTSGLSVEQRKFLPLFATWVLESSVAFEDDHGTCQVINQNEMITLLNEKFLHRNVEFGLINPERKKPHDIPFFSCNPYNQNLTLTFQTEVSKMTTAFPLIHMLLCNSILDAQDINHSSRRVVHKLTSITDPNCLMKSILDDILYKSNSNVRASNFIRQSSFLQEIIEGYEDSKGFGEFLCYIMHSIRMTLLRPKNLTVHVIGDFEKMNSALPPSTDDYPTIMKLLWATFWLPFEGAPEPGKQENMDPKSVGGSKEDWEITIENYNLRNESEEKKAGTDEKLRIGDAPDLVLMKKTTCIQKFAHEIIVELRTPSGNPASLMQAMRIPMEQNHSDENAIVNYAKLLVTLRYFTLPKVGLISQALESKDLQCEFDMELIPNECMLYFWIRSSSLVQAYEVILDIVLRYLNEPGIPDWEPPDFPVEWSEQVLAEAKNDMTFRMLQDETNPWSLSRQVLFNHYRDVPSDFSRTLLNVADKVSLDDVKQVSLEYLRDFFLDQTTCVIVSPKDDVAQLIKGFQVNAGKNFTPFPDLQYSFLSKW